LIAYVADNTSDTATDVADDAIVVATQESVSSPFPSTQSLEYDRPLAIHQRYVNAREAWYQAQPPNTITSDQEYRKAMELPLSYSSTYLTYRALGRLLPHYVGNQRHRRLPINISTYLQVSAVSSVKKVVLNLPTIPLSH
jgi:hypothetical protein